jgi:8-oxo-dGTP pyrophosphatase MutT (NUDIX family)
MAHPKTVQEIKAALAKVEVVQPTPEKKRPALSAVVSGRNLLDPKLLQQQLSYELNEKKEDKERRPKVFIQSATKAKKKLATYGFDMFRYAKIDYKKPLVVVRQDRDTKDVIISSVQTLDWLAALKRNAQLGRNHPDSVHIVPAGAFSYRHNAFGATVRALFRLNKMQMTPRKMLGKKFPPVRLAAVVIPRVKYMGETHLMITQRVHKKKGTYNDMYVFPGGHVEAGETLAQGALREFQEETGLDMELSTMKLVCCWEEVLPAKSLQFLMLVYVGDVSVPASRASGEFEWGDLSLQKAEVATLALMPENLWADVSTRADSKATIPGVRFEKAGSDAGDRTVVVAGDGGNTDVNTGAVTMTYTNIPANDITGHDSGFGTGIGSGHRFALLQYLHPFDKDIHVDLPARRSSYGGISHSVSYKFNQARKSLMRTASVTTTTTTQSSSSDSNSMLQDESTHSTRVSLHLNDGGNIVGLSPALEDVMTPDMFAMIDKEPSLVEPLALDPESHGDELEAVNQPHFRPSTPRTISL